MTQSYFKESEIKMTYNEQDLLIQHAVLKGQLAAIEQRLFDEAGEDLTSASGQIAASEKNAEALDKEYTLTEIYESSRRVLSKPLPDPPEECLWSVTIHRVLSDKNLSLTARVVLLLGMAGYRNYKHRDFAKKFSIPLLQVKDAMRRLVREGWLCDGDEGYIWQLDKKNR